MTILFLGAIVLLIAYGYATGNQVVASASGSATPTPAPTTTNKQTTITATVPVSVNPAKPANTSGNYYRSDGSLTGSAITNDVNTWPGSDAYDAICTAIALAEGYNQGAGTAPYDLNNPGDLSPGDENGQPTCGPAQFHGGSNVIWFCTVENGWTALRDKFQNIVNGDSSVYADTDTWATVASKYAGNSAAWLNNVTNYLGVDPGTTPADYVNGATSA